MLPMNVKNRRCFPETMYLSFQITFAHMAFLFAAFSAFSAIFMVSFRATDTVCNCPDHLCFQNKGTTFACFHSDRTVPDLMERFTKCVTQSAITTVLSSVVDFKTGIPARFK